MMKFLTKSIVRILIILQCSLFSSTLFSQTDYEFWFVAPAVAYEFVAPSPIILQNLNQPVYLYLTAYDSSAVVTISQPANPSFAPIICTVLPNSNFKVDLTPFLDQIENKPANQINPFGIRISSTKPITAYYELESIYNGEIFSLKGKNALGTEFIVPAQSQWQNYPFCNPPARNAFDIVATEDSTNIQITPTSNIIGHTAGIQFSILLNRGQTWSGRAVSGDSTGHLGGTSVLSDNPIAITVSDDEVNPIPTETYGLDLAGDQLIPKSVCGTEYIPAGSARWIAPWVNRIYIYAFDDSTIVYKGGTQIALLNKGESFSFIRTDIIWPFIYITSTKKILVYYMGCEGTLTFQPDAFIEPPIECTGSRKVVFTHPTAPYGLQIWITTKNGNQGSFTFSGTPPITVGGWYPVEGTNGQWLVGRTTFSPTTDWLPNQTRVISNSKGRFQTFFACNTNSNYSGAQICITDYSSLYLGPDFQFCRGDSTILDAGFGRDTYLWSTGDTTQTIWVKIQGIYWVNTTGDSCQLSDTIVTSYYWTNPINLGTDKVLCAGDSILLDAGPGRAWYDWSTGDTTQTIYINQPGTYWVKAPDVHCNVYDTIQITWMDSIDIGPNRSICPGDSVLLDAGVGMNSYLWNTGATTQTIWAKNTGKYKVTVTQGTCIFSDSLMVSFNQTPIVILGPDISICLGQTHTFDAGFCTGCTYSWDDLTTNQMNIGINQTYSTGQAGIYRVTVTGTNGCLGRDTVQLTVYPPMTVSISITASGNPVCEGTIATFKAHPVNGGTAPVYQWYKGLTLVGSNSDTFSYIPVNGDVITVVMTSSPAPCLTGSPTTSNAVTMTVNPILPAGVTIAANANPVCAGTSVTFTAIPINGGTSPVYQWFKGLTPVGSNSDTYFYIPANGDVITVVMTSTPAPCLTGSPATSNAISMTVNTVLPASLTITASANPVCAGISVTFTATPVNGGTTPIYQWKVNGNNAGGNSPIFSYIPQTGDSIRCIMTSNLACVSNNPVSSNKIVMTASSVPLVTFTLCFDSITTVNAKPIKLKGGIPLGGTYSGPGVNSITGVFTQSAAGIGTKAITYSYTNIALCSASKTKSIIVQTSPAFNCGNNLTDIRDNKEYPTIQIGSQCWMAADLDYGLQIPETSHQRDNCVPEKYKSAVGSSQSSFYQWDEVMQYQETPGLQGLCPPGWHVPTEAEWNTLFAIWTNNGFAGAPLKYSGYSGFNALMSGVRHLSVQWDYQDEATFFWSSTPYGAYKAWAHGINDYDPSVAAYPSSRANAFSVRCLKDF